MKKNQLFSVVVIVVVLVALVSEGDGRCRRPGMHLCVKAGRDAIPNVEVTDIFQRKWSDKLI